MSDAPELEDALVVRYTISNQSNGILTNLYAGLFFDWDVYQLDPSKDQAGFDEARQVGYVQAQPQATKASRAEFENVLVGTTLLTRTAPLTYSAINNAETNYCDLADGGFTAQEKWNFLSGDVQNKTIGPADVSQVIGAGPYTIEPGSSIKVAFGIVVGDDLNDLLANVDAIQSYWDTTILPTATEDLGPDIGRFVLYPAYPNPTTTSATISFEVAEPSHVKLTVYDLLGRRVETLYDDTASVGRHDVVWNGRDRTGRRLAGGLYLVRFKALGPKSDYTGLQIVTLLK